MVRTGWLAVVALALFASPGLAQFGGMGGMGGMGGGMGGMGGGMGGMGRLNRPMETWNVKFETFEGESVTGKLTLPSVAVSCNLGYYEIKPGKIKTVELEPMKSPLIISPSGAEREGAVVTASGEKVAGKIHVPNWNVETELGFLTPSAEHLKTMTFIGRVSGPEESNTVKPAPAAQPLLGQPEGRRNGDADISNNRGNKGGQQPKSSPDQH
ncbi:hypothetical protein P12x_000180 [Tundrisphaera lichenicola]|uniref:hypothetical protein n=1 Tax=Tundrisphaera lichenicola TaxID=2029860 RepID=UPI003EB7B431